MLRRDAWEILKIETDLYSDPMTTEEIKAAINGAECIGRVIEDGKGHIAGYIIYSLFGKNVYQIIRMSVRRDLQRQGTGTALINILKDKLTKKKAIAIKVQERALDTQLFLKALGFTCTGTIPEYGNNGDDVYLFEFWR